MDDSSGEHADLETIDPGETVYDSDGRPVGRVVGPTEEGFEVETDPVAGDDGEADEELPGQGFGEGYLMWRCEECGEMGEVEDGLPESCPNCGAAKELISEQRED